MKKFGEGVSDAQIRLARRFQEAQITSYSQAIKAFMKRDNKQIEEWKELLKQKDEANGHSWK